MFQKRSTLLLFLVSVLLFLAGQYGLFLFSSKIGTEDGGGLWKGYYQLFFDGEYSSSAITNILNGTKIGKIITEDTEKVSVFTYDGPRTLPLSEVPDFFVSNDPLYDPYLKALPDYFRGRFRDKNISIVYIPSVLSPFRTWLELHKHLKSFDKWWFFPDFRVVNVVLKLVFVILVEVFLYMLFGKGKRYFLVTLLPWLFPLFFGNILHVLAAVSFQFCWFLLVLRARPRFQCYLNYSTSENWRKIKGIIPQGKPWTRPVKRILQILFTGHSAASCGVFHLSFSALIRERNQHIVPLHSLRLRINPGGFLLLINILMFFLGIIIFKKSANSLLVLFTALFVQGVTTILDFGLIYFKHKTRSHKLFLPVTIREKRHCLKHGEMYAAALLVFIVLSAPLVQRYGIINNKLIVPVPTAELGNVDFSLKELGILHGLKTSDSLPDLSDFITHRAFQDVYMYGMSYSFPVPDSSFTFTSFSRDGKVVIKRYIQKKLFTEQWYKSIMSSVDSHGIVGMLVGQGYPVGVKRIEKRFIPGEKGFLLRYYSLSIFLILPFLIFVGNVGFVQMNGIKRIFIRRRRQVV